MTAGMPREKVGGVFDGVAPYYDAMNDYLSLGTHHWWKHWFCDQVIAVSGGKWVDLATGTGDILIGLLKRQVAQNYYAVDPSGPMLELAQDRLCAEGFNTPRARSQHCINFVNAAAEDLSCFNDASIDGLSCAFGLRNMSDRPKALAEIARILKPSGQCHILEFAPPGPSFPMRLYAQYLHYCLPLVGQIAFGDRASYDYLASSIASFWTPQQCQMALKEVGFSFVSGQKVFGGIAYYYKGVV